MSLPHRCVQSLEWFKLDEKLSSDPGWYPAVYPLPTGLDVTCTIADLHQKTSSEILYKKEISSSCSVACGTGTRTITTITCSNQLRNGECAYTPEYSVMEVECTEEECPGKYGQWLEWSPCTKSCTTGKEKAMKTRTRSCIGKKCEDDCNGGTIGKK